MSFYATHDVNTKTLHNKSRVCFLWLFSVLWIKIWFDLKDSQINIQVRPINLVPEIHLKCPINACESVF